MNASDATPRELSVSEDDDGRRLELMLGAVLRVSLYEAPATGYRWQWQWQGEPGGALQMIDSGYQASSSATGSGGHAWWRLRGVSPGVTALHARRARAWQDGPANAAFTITVGCKAAHD